MDCFISERSAATRLLHRGGAEFFSCMWNASSKFWIFKMFILLVVWCSRTVNTKLMDILWQSYYGNSRGLAMFLNSPLLYASNTKCAKMYKLWREIHAEKTGGTGELSKTERDWKHKAGISKYIYIHRAHLSQVLVVFKLCVDVLILVIVYTATIQTHDQYLRSIHLYSLILHCCWILI